MALGKSLEFDLVFNDTAHVENMERVAKPARRTVMETGRATSRARCSLITGYSGVPLLGRLS